MSDATRHNPPRGTTQGSLRGLLRVCVCIAELIYSTRVFGGFQRTPNFFLYFFGFFRTTSGRDGLSPLPPDSPRQLDVLRHDRHPLRVDRAQVGVLEQTHQVRLRRLLKGEHGVALKTQIGLEVLGDLTDQPLEGQLADQQLGTLLVLTDLTKSDGSWPVAMGLLHSSGGGGRLPRSLRNKLLPGSLSSGGLTCCLLGTSHCDTCRNETAMRAECERRN
ncbi:hypothetical protein KC19_8G097000 [Ceratodon purpureus]|uniref:Uncharacterized protein n=1 Tax=Ceratodon purpureus TaxID=3225 RepID=A0A8T0H0L2_CERPU|nr:hypothetical protein KC19_8G097000 [Ceratodon purpureus]